MLWSKARRSALIAIVCGGITTGPTLFGGPEKHIVYRSESQARQAMTADSILHSSRSDDEFHKARDAQATDLAALSPDQIKQLLRNEQKLSDVLNTLGLPISASLQENDGSLWYALPRQRDLIFWIKGDYVSAARFDHEDIVAVTPRSYHMTVGATVSVIAEVRSASSPWFNLEDERFPSYVDFQKRLAALPKGTVLEWQRTCERFPGEVLPIDTKEQIEAFTAYCRRIGIRLIVYPAG